MFMDEPILPTHWQTKSGVVIAIRDMDKTHLANTLAMFDRNASDLALKAQLKLEKQLKANPNLYQEEQLEWLMWLDDFDFLNMCCTSYIAIKYQYEAYGQEWTSNTSVNNWTANSNDWEGK